MSADLSPRPGERTQYLALHLVEEINHRVFNEYTEVIAILMKDACHASPAAGRALAQAADRLHAHAETHRALLAPRATGPVELGREIGKLCEAISRASLARRNIELSVATDDIWIDGARSWRIGLIVSELIRNSVRHGLRGAAGAIRVNLTRKGSWARCAVTDNGVGVQESAEGRGRRLVRALTTELGGSATWRFTGFGSIVGIDFPISEASVGYGADGHEGVGDTIVQ